MSIRTRGSWRRSSVINPVAVAAVLVFIAATAVTTPAAANAKLWLYPDSDDPQAGGHVVTEGEFTLNIENRGTGGGDNTAYDTFLLVAVNDPGLLSDGTITLPDGTVSLDPATMAFGLPSFDCSDATIPPHGVYPAYVAEIPVGDIAQGEVVQAPVVINGSEGLEVHFDAKAVGYRQAGPNLRCYDVINPSGHDVTLVLEDPGNGPCHEVFIEKAAGATGVALNDPMDYVITVENRGTCELTDVVVTEDIPMVLDAQGQPVPAFTVTAIDPPPTTQIPASIEWVVGTLDPGAVVTAVVSVVFDQPAAVGLEIVNTACTTSFELPDPACSSATVVVGATAGDHIGGVGFWCNQLRFAREGRPNAQFTTAELEGWLLDIVDESTVFPELWPLAELIDAEDMLCRPSQADTMADKAARHLLALWFNVAAERLPLDTMLGDLCPGDEEPPSGMDPTMTVAGLIAGAEADLLAGADDPTLELWKDIIDYVNNASLPGPAGCDGEAARRSGHHRRLTNRP